jgi:hypothetical protein
MANATWNPADLSRVTLTGGNLIASVLNGPGVGGVRATVPQSSGKFYFEVVWAHNTTNITSGLSLASASVSAPASGAVTINRSNGKIFVNNSDSGVSATLGGSVPDSVVGCAVDLSAQLVWFRVGAAGAWNGAVGGNPAAGTGGVSLSPVAGALFPMMAGQSNDAVTANFGDSAFSGAVPSGFTAGWPATSVIPASTARVMVLA